LNHRTLCLSHTSINEIKKGLPSQPLFFITVGFILQSQV
jgi:hypothetical protein